MNKTAFINEINDTLKISLNPDDVEYDYKDTSGLRDHLGGNTVAAVGPDTGEVTITYFPTKKSKKYDAGHGTTFPCEFIKDWEAGYFEG